MNDRNNLAVVYARYSAHGQTEQSIEGQLAEARAYAAKKGYTIIHEYADRAMTGRNDNRDEFQKMLADTAKKQFGVVIVWKVDRFGRNREEITFNKYRCKKNGVRVEYVKENVPDGPEGVILESVLEGMAEYFSLQLSQNVQRGMKESAKKYKFLGGHLPLGYAVDEDNYFIEDPKTAPTVRLIFDWYAKGSTIFEIINRLNAMGLKTAAGNKFTRSSLNTILKNEKYIGVYRFKDQFCVEDAIPAIVNPDTFEKVQQMLKVNRRAPSRKWSYTDYLLTDKLFCGMCGSPMTGMSGFGKGGMKYSYYACVTHRKEHTCKKKPIRQDAIEKTVIEETRSILEDDTALEFIAEKTWEFYCAQDETHEKIRSIQTQLEATEKGIANLLKVLERGIVSDATVNRLEELENEKAALQAAMNQAQLEGGFRIDKGDIYYMLEQFKNLDYDDRSCQRRLVNTFINSIFLYDDGTLKLSYNFGGDSRKITLSDVEKDSGEVFACCLPRRAITSTVEHRIMWLSHVFVIQTKMPER